MRARGNTRPVYLVDRSPGESCRRLTNARQGGCGFIVSVIRVADAGHEGFFVNTSMTPEDLRRNLSPVFVALQRHTAASGAQPPLAGTEDDLTGKLERLAALHASGSLTDQEFAEAKRALLT
jgi:hypothetical protein